MRNGFRRKFTASLLLGAALSTGMIVAQAYPWWPARGASKQASTQLPVSMNVSTDSLAKYPLLAIDAETDGKKVKYSGVPLRVILGDLMPELNLSEMPGWKALSRQELVVEVMGSDGYPGLVTGTELAINKAGDRFVLATKCDGKPNEHGIQLICHNDEARTRWVREVVSVRVVSVAKN